MSQAPSTAPADTVDPVAEDAEEASEAQEDAPASMPGCEESDSDLYCIYDVLEGDTLSGIAAKAGLDGTEGVSPWQLLVESNRPELVSENDVLQVGARLRIPKQNGLIHAVHSQETLSDLAQQYDIAMADIIYANGLADADFLQIGQEILIPSPNRLEKRAPELPETSTGVSEAPGTDDSGSGTGFTWPAYGPITNYFGPSHPLGIDIDVDDSSGAANVAAAAGIVTFAGGNPCCSYGYYVIVDHGGGVQTLYAHFASLSIGVGEQVAAGQPLGVAGSTGYSTGIHLHFEVLSNGTPVDPMAFLP